MTIQPETLEQTFCVIPQFCEHTPTVIGETLGVYDPMSDFSDSPIGPFDKLMDARRYIVRAFEGREILPYGMTLHSAEIVMFGDSSADYCDRKVEKWSSNDTRESKCRLYEAHQAGEIS